MGPPSYSDLGKEARDIFSKNYHFGLIKLNCKTKSPLGMEFLVSGASQMDSGKVDASLESKYVFQDLGATFKEKWSTNNTLATDITIEDLCFKGLKLGIGGNFSPQTGAKKLLVKSGFSTDALNLNLDFDMDHAAWLVNGSAVAMYQGWVIGANVNFDVRSRHFNKTNMAMGYINKDFILHTNVNNGQEFGGSVYQKVNEKLQSGIHISWTTGSALTKFGFGCVYKLDGETQFRGMVNNSSQIGLGLTHKLKPGITMHLSAHLDGKTFTQGGHKLGIGIEMEA